MRLTPQHKAFCNVVMKTGNENQQLAGRMLQGRLFWTVAHIGEKMGWTKSKWQEEHRKQLESASALAGAVVEGAGGTKWQAVTAWDHRGLCWHRVREKPESPGRC